MEKETALEILRKLRGKLLFSERTAIETFIPELKESDDELMRKEAIAIIKQYNIICERDGDKCYTADKVITWLEKQGKQKPTDEEMKTLLQTEYEKGRADVIAEFEQGWTEEDTDTLKWICRIIFRAKQDRLITQKEENFLGTWIDKWLNHSPERKEQGEQKPNPYSGTSFEYNGHTWGMCARDNGVEILIDGHLKGRVFTDDSNDKEMFIKSLERVEEQNDKGYKLSDCDKNSWWEDFKTYTSFTVKQKPFDYENATIAPKDFATKEEPKFKVGDWVVKNDDSSVCVDYSICKITKVENGNYTIESIYGYKGYVTFKTFEKDYHIFTIEEDAKDGDVLAIGYEYFLFKEKKEDTSLLDPPVYTSHCFVNSSGAFRVTNGRECGEFHSIENEISACPATKEQRDFLFQQMKKSGYEWDADKKELKIIDCNNIKYEPNGPSVIEEKPIEKKTKFNIGDWVTNGEYNWKITAINSLYYTLQSQDGDMSVEDTIANVKKYLHHWTIQDAKEGDVLVDVIDKRPFIFKGLLDSIHPNCPVAYCGIDLGHNFMIAYSDSWWTYKKVIPATKEQRDFLFQQMKEAGYEWDANEKKLIKI